MRRAVGRCDHITLAAAALRTTAASVDGCSGAGGEDVGASGVAVPGFGTGGGALRGWLLLLGAVSDNGPPLPPLGGLDAT